MKFSINVIKKETANLDKSKLFVLHPTPHIATHGEFPEPVFVTMTPVIVWERIKYFYEHLDVLEKHLQFDFTKETLNGCVLPYYVVNGAVQTDYRDFIVVDGEKLNSLFPFVDFSNFLSVEQLECFGGVSFLDDNGVVDEKTLLEVLNKHLQRCNEIIDTLQTIDPIKFALPSVKAVENVKPEKFINAKAKGVGFGNANYIVYENFSLMIDFGGLDYAKRDFSDFTMSQNDNYILLTHWHIDHYCNFSYLNFPSKNAVHFLAPTQFYGLAELYVLFYMAQFSKTVNLIPMGADYAKNPQFIINDSIFIYGANYSDHFFAIYAPTKSVQMYIDLNSACLFAINPIASGIVNIYSGDQKYQYMQPALENFNNSFAIDSIDLIHATHHGLLAAPVSNKHEVLALKINDIELKGNAAIISNDFGRFKENPEHKIFLESNFQNVLTTHYNDIVAYYEPGKNACELSISETSNQENI